MKTHVIFHVLAVGLVSLLNQASAATCTDAVVLGLEVSGDLLAPAALVDQIDQDLNAIFLAYPDLTDISVIPDWVPGDLLVGLTEEAFLDYQAGLYTGLDDLNAQYGPVAVTAWAFIHCLHLEFAQCYHSERLADIYRQAEGVLYANANYVNIDGSDISCPQLSYYTFKRGWGDCASGCLYEDYWDFHVEDGTVELLAQYGSSWSDVPSAQQRAQAAIGQNYPNPFNPSTRISFSIPRDGFVSLVVYSLDGRLVRTLVSDFKSAGEYEAEWTGLDDQGCRVASGTYFYRLRAEEFCETKKMTLLK